MISITVNTDSLRLALVIYIFETGKGIVKLTWYQNKKIQELALSLMVSQTTC